jgi:hypothetical protein
MSRRLRGDEPDTHLCTMEAACDEPDPMGEWEPWEYAVRQCDGCDVTWRPSEGDTSRLCKHCMAQMRRLITLVRIIIKE